MLNPSRRSVLARATALIAASALSPSSFLGIAQAQALSKRLLIIASSNDITNFDPHAGADEPTTLLLRNTYDALVKVQADPPKLVPGLAASWTMSESGLEYIFKLDPAAKFHDGSPVTATAVAYSFDRLLRLKKGNAWMIAGILDVGSVQAVDAATVKIVLAKPFGALLQVLPWIFIVNPKLVEANKGSDDGQSYLRNTIAGSGPFRVRRAEPGNLYELERLADGWKKGGGNTSGIIYKIVRESSNQRLMIQRGDAHLALKLTNDDVAALKDKPGITLVVKPELRSFLFRMNTKRGPLADINLRRAVSFATDYKGLLDVAVYAKPAKGPLPEGLFGFDTALTVHPTDLQKAKEYLAKAQVPTVNLKLVVCYISGYEQQRRWCLVLLDSLKKIGIDLEIRPLTWPDMVAAARTPETCPDIFSMFTSVNYADPADVSFNHYHSSRVGNWSNPTYANPRVDALIEQGRSELNKNKRKQIYVDFQKAVIDDAPDLFVASDVRIFALRKEVGGFVYTPIRPGAIDLFPLSLT